MITEKYVLKKLKIEEIDLFINEIFQITQNYGFQNFSNIEVTNIYQCKNYINFLLDKSDYYGIYSKTNINVLIGYIGFHTDNYLGYIINENFYNQKIISSIFPVFISYGKLIKKFNEINTVIEFDNKYSIKLMDKFNFQLIGNTEKTHIYNLQL